MKKLNAKCLIIGLAMILFGATIGCNKKSDKVNQFETVLKIGDIKLTKNQYLKQRNIFIGTNNIDTLAKSKLQEFNQSIIDDCYLLADAFSKGYQKNDSILEVVNAVADFMLVQYDGYLWRRTKAKQTEVTKEEIEKIYNQPHVIYFLDAICFKKRIISDTTNDYKIAKIKSPADFDYYQSLSKTDSKILNSNMMSSWPVYELAQGNDVLKNTAIGAILGPIRTTDGVIFAKLTKKDIVKKHPFKQEEERLKMVLGNLKADKIIINEQIVCENTCKPKYYDENIVKFIKIKDNKNSENDVLAEYYISGKIKRLTVSQFKSFLKYWIFQIKMNDLMDAKINIREKIACDYLMVKVDSLNLRKDSLFIDEHDGYLKKLVLNYYLTKQLKPDLKNLDIEVKKYYDQNEKTYKEPENLKVSCFEFDNRQCLREAQEIINNAYIIGNASILSDTSLVKGLKYYKPDLIIKRSNTFLSTKNYDALLKLPFNVLSNEFAENGKFYLFYKTQKSGESLKPFGLVKEEIQSKLINDKNEIEKQQLLKQLKNKYTIELNSLSVIKDIN